ncbi:MAG: PIN domain-containing protein [Betaproteobacteria bacterium]|nr:PIN domain-containing protein [Betaproteobacteria bacterium]
MPAAKRVSRFFDSNVLLYLISKDTRKAEIAQGLLREGGTISVQVLNEVANVAHRKAGMAWPEIAEFLDAIRPLVVVRDVNLETHELAIKLVQRQSLGIHDAAIVAAALIAQCTELLTEDMQDGLLVNKTLRIRNPFR